jgi:uncharacterized membrane protein
MKRTRAGVARKISHETVMMRTKDSKSPFVVVVFLAAVVALASLFVDCANARVQVGAGQYRHGMEVKAGAWLKVRTRMMMMMKRRTKRKKKRTRNEEE